LAAASRDLCGAKTRSGGTCGLTAGHGTDHVGFGNCRHHGGCTPTGAKYGARLLGAHLAEGREVEPHEALLECLYAAAGEARFFGEKIAGLGEDEVVVTFERVRESSIGDGGTETITSTHAELSIWVRARSEALERMAKFAKAAIDAGVAERQVRVVEQWAQPISEALQAIVEKLGLNDEQRRRAPEIIRSELRLLEQPKAAA
jgi:hypothetical protein